MQFNDLLNARGIDPAGVLMLRHRPTEPALRRALPWFAADHPDLFNAYQATQSRRVETMMTALSHLAAFIAIEANRAAFVGLYEIGRAPRRVDRATFWSLEGYATLRELGMRGFADEDARSEVFHFDLRELSDFYSQWRGRLIIDWPGPARAWSRRAHKNVMPVYAIHEESLFARKIPHWTEIDLGWSELAILPMSWRAALAQWRGIYFIFDDERKLGYVGSATGAENLLGRWQGYARTGDGGNVLLRQSKRECLRFSILQRLDPDIEPEAAIAIETSWKLRLHTRAPTGLNAN